SFFPPNAIHQIPESKSRSRIEAGCRFIEEQYRRGMEKAAEEVHTPFQPSRKLSDAVALSTFKLQERQQLGDSSPSLGASEPVKRGVRHEILAHPELVVEGDFLKHNPDPPTGLMRLLSYVNPHHVHRTGRGLDECRKNSEQRRLAATVWSQKSEHLTLSDAQRDVLQGRPIPITMGQSSYFHGVLGHQPALNR